jgi:hypothetical protein
MSGLLGSELRSHSPKLDGLLRPGWRVEIRYDAWTSLQSEGSNYESRRQRENSDRQDYEQAFRNAPSSSSIVEKYRIDLHFVAEGLRRKAGTCRQLQP